MSGRLEHHVSPHGLAPGNGYSQVVSAAAGRLVAVSGQVALDDQGEVVGAGDPRVQTEQVFENLGAALAAAGATFADVIKLTYFVLDVAVLPMIREVRDRHVDTERPPASSAFQVGALFRPDLLLEVEALAVTDSR
jgi:enamine deaminase RidA (YjgF/YER057c/UK114 family)